MPAVPHVRGGDVPAVTPEQIAAANKGPTTEETSMIETMGMAEHHVEADT
jgi:hypothetical protein